MNKLQNFVFKAAILPFRYLFDGTVLYTIKRLHPEPLELYSDRKTDGERMRIMIKVSCLLL